MQEINLSFTVTLRLPPAVLLTRQLNNRHRIEKRLGHAAFFRCSHLLFYYRVSKDVIRTDCEKAAAISVGRFREEEKVR